ncbi:MAG TPA: hypothetical protein VMW19_13255 [Myxococcota bacterium]|nr:hypothetical protein [Myxococcota bacterium]
MRSVRIAGIFAIAALVGFAVAHWVWPERGPAPAPRAAPAAAPSPSPSPSPVPQPATSDELRVASGQTVAIESSTLEPGRPVVLHLVLGEPSRTDDPRPVRILDAEDGTRNLEAKAVLDAGRSEARFEIDPAFLHPGRYIVEVKTTEAAVLPLRRYVLEVR